jgi:hypothetical protein
MFLKAREESHVTIQQMTREMLDSSQKIPTSKIQYKLHQNADVRTKDRQPNILAGLKAKIQNYQP